MGHSFSQPVLGEPVLVGRCATCLLSKPLSPNGGVKRCREKGNYAIEDHVRLQPNEVQ